MQPIDPVRGGWNDLKGFSVFPAITTYFPRLGESSLEDAGCARWWSIALSEDMDVSPTLLLDAVTMKPVPHWVELDYSSHKVDSLDAKHALLIWPATALEFNRRYIVAIRGLREAKEEGNGALVQPSPAFQRLRDMGKNTSAFASTSREGHFSELFSDLETASGGKIPKRRFTVGMGLYHQY